jgi:predicted acyl esterase
MKFLFFTFFFFVSGFSKRIRELFLVMDDGVHLHTEIVFPRNIESKMSSVLVRSPYGYFDLEIYADLYSTFGLVCIGQDWRGTGKSEGHFSVFQTEGNDGKKTVEWIKQQDWSNGKVFTFGASADGMASILLARENVSLSGQFILVSTGIGYENFYPGGVFRGGLINKWLKDTVREEDLNMSLTTIQNHSTYDDWWANIDIRNHYSLIHYPTTFYAGWYDIFTMGSIVTFDGYQKYSSLPNRHYIVIDPCGHCQDAAKYFPKNLIEGRTGIEIALNLYQFGITKKLRRDLNFITYYLMTHNDTKEGDVGNYFISVNEWPSYEDTKLFFYNTTLSFEKPITETFQTFQHQYENPCPTIGGNNYELPCGPLDQSPLLKRKDVLVFTSKPMKEPFIITGPIFVNVKAYSNTSSFHISARLTDYYKNESRLIIDSILEMNSTFGTINLWNTSYVFNPDHQIQIIISGSNYPRFTTFKENCKIKISSHSYLSLPKCNHTKTNLFQF